MLTPWDNLFRRISVRQALVMLLPIVGIVAASCLPAWLFERVPSICLIKNISGVECPGCGMLRALKYLVDGQVSQALELNWRVIVVGPLLGWIYFQWAFHAIKKGKRQQAYLIHARRCLMQRGLRALNSKRRQRPGATN